MSSPFLSIAIPAYNEAERISKTLRSINTYLSEQQYVSEVIVVDDGSSDSTVEVVQSYISDFLKNKIELRILSNQSNRGKGYSVRCAFLESKGEIVLFSDADLSTPITESHKLINPIACGEYDLVFGSRTLNNSLVGQHQSWKREIAGKMFNRLMQATVKLPFSDTQCGFKAFRKAKLQPIFEQQKIYGFGFDVEILYLASKHHLKLCEVPVVWNDVHGSKVSLLHGLRAFIDLIRIYYRV